MADSFDVRIDFDVRIPMRDDVHLSTIILRPGREGRFPVLLSRTPYGKINESDFMLGAARNGYVVISQDVRGTGESEGTFIPMQSEVEDGWDTLDWIVSQPYAQPNVGMYGSSYVGFTQVAAAASRHPSLKAISPRVCTFNPYNMWDNGRGAFPFQVWLVWVYSAVLGQAAFRSSEETQKRYLAESIKLFDGLSTGETLKKLPLSAYPFLGDGELLPYSRHLLEDFGRYENLVNPVPERWQPEIPTLFIGGWYDPFTTRHLADWGITADNPLGHRIFIGPWDHFIDNQEVGDLDFGHYASPFSILLNDVLLRWFDHTLKGISSGLAQEPPVKAFEMGSNCFRMLNTWPPEGSIEHTLYLHSSSKAGSTIEDGTLSFSKPLDEPADEYLYDPANPVPSVGGALLRSSSVQTGPRDQSRIEQRSDVLVYTGLPVKNETTIAGPVRVILWVSTDAADTDFCARLVDVHPDGRSYNILHSLTRLRFRYPEAGPTSVNPGEIYKLELDLGATFHTYLPGHRIRVDICSSDFPLSVRNLNTDEDLLNQENMVKANNTVYHNKEHPSCLVFTKK